MLQLILFRFLDKQFRTESRRVLNIAANIISCVEADKNRTVLLNCLLEIRTLTHNVINFLQDDANSMIFSYANSTISGIEAGMNSQLNELRLSINAQTDIKC